MDKQMIRILAILVVAYIFFKYLMGFFAPFVVGLGIALLLEPFVGLLVRRCRFRRGLASFIGLLILTLVGASLGMWGVSSLTQEAAEFLEAAPDYISALQEWLAAYPFLPVAGLLEWAGEWLSAQSIKAVGHVPGILIWILLILVSAFFFSRDREMIFGFVARWCPDWIGQYAKPVGERLHEAAVGFLKSEFILLSMVAAVSIVGLWMMGSPYAMMLGLAIAVLDSLPVVGAGLVLWPWAGYAFFAGQHSLGAGLLVLYGVVTVIRNVLGPRILGDQIGMHPLAALMAIFVGIKAFGAAGILAGPALVIAAQTMMEERQRH
ncbi:MAG: AI-2E family transporter [Defluviitaleaceae bacterium]|nr:AI-2E family transporter [Defluviitaleaceae bacterium]